MDNTEPSFWSENEVKDFMKGKGLSDNDIEKVFAWVEEQHDVWHQDGWEDGYDEGYSDCECRS